MSVRTTGARRSASGPVDAEALLSAHHPAGPGPVGHPAGLARELEELDRLDLGQLRVQFRNRTGRIAPARISRPLLLRVLAYRIQVQAFGDLRADVRRMLGGLAAANATDANSPGERATSSPALVRPRPRPGTVLAREWQGRMEQVMVLQDSFAWNGTTYTSLSAIALAMTGTKWNGHRFFGLRDRAEAVAPSPDATSDRSRTPSRIIDHAEAPPRTVRDGLPSSAGLGRSGEDAGAGSRPTGLARPTPALVSDPLASGADR